MELIDGLKIHVEEYGSGKPIILLHGWGASGKTFEGLKDHLNAYRVIVFDLPGFGDSEEVKKDFNLDYYVKIIRMYVEKHELEEPIILGHSFGGRIAIKYASIYPVRSLILVDSAGIKRRDFKYYIKVYSYKILKSLGIKINTGSTDYQNASPIMKEVLKRVTDEDLRDALKLIKAKTLIVWGENDLVTPLADAFLMETLITDSGLVIIPKVGHYCYLEDFNYFILVLDSFLSSLESEEE